MTTQREKLEAQINQLEANELNIVVFSQDANDGKGGWEAGFPEAISSDDLDAWFKNNAYNSMVNCNQFKDVEEAIFFYENY